MKKLIVLLLTMLPIVGISQIQYEDSESNGDAGVDKTYSSFELPINELSQNTPLPYKVDNSELPYF